MMREEEENKPVLADPVRLLPVAVGLFFMTRAMIEDPVSSSVAVNIAVYVFVFISGLFVMIGAALLTVFIVGKVQGVQDYDPPTPIGYIIAFIGLLTGIASALIVLGFAKNILP